LRLQTTGAVVVFGRLPEAPRRRHPFPSHQRKLQTRRRRFLVAAFAATVVLRMLKAGLSSRQARWRLNQSCDCHPRRAKACHYKESLPSNRKCAVDRWRPWTASGRLCISLPCRQDLGRLRARFTSGFVSGLGKGLSRPPCAGSPSLLRCET
jgi:hypothetical protein